MTIQQIIEEKVEGLKELWNEHDGTHFYMDEFKDFLTSAIKEAVEKAFEETRVDPVKSKYKKDYHEGIFSDILGEVESKQKEFLGK